MSIRLPRSLHSLACVAVIGGIGLGACANSLDGPEAGFASPELAARAFAPSDLPVVEPWDDSDGACRVLLIGDSLTEAIERAQSDAFTFVGCESIVDGLVARSLSNGWQCLGSGGESTAISIRAVPEPGNSSCRPSGLELLGLWSEIAHVASAVVIALGTNDAGIYTEEGWIRRWDRAATLTSGPLVFVTAAARPGDPWAAKVERYNETLRWWCPLQPRCVLAEWDRTAPAKNPNSYVDNVHLTRAAGEMRAVFIATVTRQFAVPAPAGPQRWRAPAIELPQGPSSTPSSPAAPFPLNPPVTNPGVTNPAVTNPGVTNPGGPSWPPQPTTTISTVPTSPSPSSPTTTTSTTTTTLPTLEPPTP